MKVRYKESKDIRDIVLDFTESRFSADEIVKQVAQRLHDNQGIHSLVIENIALYEKGAHALRHAILGHKSLRSFAILDAHLYSYPVTTDDEYFFPLDLDKTVEHLCAILRDARLHQIKITDLDFHDQTQRHFQHYDMVDPVSMRDLLTQEKEPFYIQEVLYALNHNPHIHDVELTTVDLDVAQQVEEIKEAIKKRQAAEKLNAVFQGTHAAVETHFMPEIFKLTALWAWMNKFRRR